MLNALVDIDYLVGHVKVRADDPARDIETKDAFGLQPGRTCDGGNPTSDSIPLLQYYEISCCSGGVCGLHIGVYTESLMSFRS